MRSSDAGCKKEVILYISYDGLTDALGQSQVVSLLRGIAKESRLQIIILSYDKQDIPDFKGKAISLNDEINSLGIKWICLKYHKFPKVLSTLYDVIRGIWVTYRIRRKEDIALIHCRSYVSAIIGLFFKKLSGINFIFDMRGFWPEERMEAGIWRDIHLYKIAKFFEKKFIQNADAVVTLTEIAKQEIITSGLTRNELIVYSIGTLVDTEYFRVRAAKENRSGKLIFIYTGSLGTWYELGAIYDFFIQAKKMIPNAYLMILTSQISIAKEKVRERSPRLSFEDVGIEESPYIHMPYYLNKSDIGIAFYKPGYSRKGCCPVKVAEYLACGIPVVINSGVGDMDRIITDNDVGAVISGFSDSEYCHAVDKIMRLLADPLALGQRCRKVAEEYFSLAKGINAYIGIYDKLLKK